MYGLLNDGLWKYNRTFWIAIPVYNFALFLDDCFKSINKQTYKNVQICILNDGSTDDSLKLINRWIPVLKRSGFISTVINFTLNKGPGYTKWKAIEYIRTRANPNDIFTILDGDDYYTKEHAIERILMEYIKTGCWFTYGSAEGANTKQGKLVTEFTRKKMDSFPFQHPRSCLVHLLNKFSKDDFKDTKNEWIKRGSDREFIYKCVELAGVERISYIEEPIYFYRTHKDNVRNKIDNTYKNSIEDLLINRTPNNRIDDIIHIVMCSYKRQHLLSKIIESVDNQICDKQIIFHIINTNTDEWETTQDIVSINKTNKIKIRLINTNENLYGYARFLYVKKLLKSDFVQTVVFIDDDQILKSDWIENAYVNFQPFSYICWHGRIFKHLQDNDKQFSYWDSKLLYDDIVKNNAKQITEFDYGATSGAVIDAQIFNFEVIFRCPVRFRMIEDLWLSFIIKHILGQCVQRLFSTPVTNIAELYNKHDDDSLFLKLKEDKQKCLEELVESGFLNGETIKTDILNKMLVNDDSHILLSKFVIV